MTEKKMIAEQKCKIYEARIQELEEMVIRLGGKINKTQSPQRLGTKLSKTDDDLNDRDKTIVKNPTFGAVAK